MRRPAPTGGPAATSHAGGAGSRPAPAPPLSRRLVVTFAVTCGLAVANVYNAQPLLPEIATTFDLSEATVGAVVTVTQVGYGLGLFLLVPLGDLLNRRRLVVVAQVLTVVALVTAATAPSAAVLLPALAAVGLLAVVTQVLVAYAASLAEPDRRGSVVGTVTSGVVIGILLGRVSAGLLGEAAGWRSVYLTSAALTAVVTVVLASTMPRRDEHTTALTYPQLLGSLLKMYRTNQVLRVRGVLALLTFAVFNVLWSCLALPLSASPRSLPPGALGLFGLAGAAGAVAARRAGRLADQGRGQATTGTWLALMAACWLPIRLTTSSSTVLAVAGLVTGLLLLDLSVQAVHVTSQSLIYATDPDARSRLAGAYMIFYSVGSAFGSITSTVAYVWAGWPAVCVLGGSVSCLALIVWLTTLPAVRSRLPQHGGSSPGPGPRVAGRSR